MSTPDEAADAGVAVAVTPLRVALIACSASKLPRPALACDLYTGDLFRRALAYATQPGLFDRVYILSARHHVVRLDETLAPYDRCLADRTREERAEWGCVVMESLRALHPAAERVEATFLAGADYREPVATAFARYGPPWTLKAPLKGLGIGRQRSWLAKHTTAHGPRPLTETDRRILDALGQGGPLKRSHLKARIERSQGVVASALAQLKREGRVVQVDGEEAGTWALAEDEARRRPTG